MASGLISEEVAWYLLRIGCITTLSTPFLDKGFNLGYFGALPTMIFCQYPRGGRGISIRLQILARPESEMP